MPYLSPFDFEDMPFDLDTAFTESMSILEEGNSTYKLVPDSPISSLSSSSTDSAVDCTSPVSYTSAASSSTVLRNQVMDYTSAGLISRAEEWNAFKDGTTYGPACGCPGCNVDHLNIDGFNLHKVNDDLLAFDHYDEDAFDDPFANVQYECEDSGDDDMPLLSTIDEEEDESALSPILSYFIGQPRDGDSAREGHSARGGDSSDGGESTHTQIRISMDNDSVHSSQGSGSLYSLQPPAYQEHPICIAVQRSLFPGGVEEIQTALRFYRDVTSHPDVFPGGIHDVAEALIEHLDRRNLSMDDPEDTTSNDYPESLVESETSSWKSMQRLRYESVMSKQRLSKSRYKVKAKLEQVKDKTKGKLRSLFGRQRRERAADDLHELAANMWQDKLDCEKGEYWIYGSR